MSTFWNKYSFCRIHKRPLFSIKTNLRENRFFAASWAIGDKMGTHGVEFSTENITFLRPCHGFQQANEAEFWILAYLCSVLRTWEEWLSCFCISKIIYSYQYWFTIEFCSPWFCIIKIIYSYQYWFTIGFCSPWFCITKIICSYQYWFAIAFCSPCYCITRTTNASQLIGRLEVKPFLNLKIY